MKLRSITLGINWPSGDSSVFNRGVESFFKKANTLFSEYGFEPRTCRIALPPLADGKGFQSGCSSIEQISALCEGIGIRWFCVPFRTIGRNMADVNTLAVDIAGRHKNAFLNYIIAENGCFSGEAILHTARFILAVSKLSDNGIDNFRCGASFNCKPNGAFFPFTYHSGRDGFSVALEPVPLFIEMVKSGKSDRSLEEMRNGIIAGLEPLLKRVDDICLKLEEATGMIYYGIDASLAPHPENPEHSVAKLVELLGVDCFGGGGTAFITSFLTDIIKSLIKRSGVKAAGFNGVMYSMLEDPRLGIINSEQTDLLSIDLFLLLSAMCGCGVDMVPLPGDISEEELASIMLDIAAAAIRLDKPLGVRLLPIPGKAAGQFTNFEHDFLQNTRIQRSKHHSCRSIFFGVRQPFFYINT
jgi:hypothetical protein